MIILREYHVQLETLASIQIPASAFDTSSYEFIPDPKTKKMYAYIYL